MRAYLVGQAPPGSLGYTYVDCPPYEAVVIGSLELGELLCFQNPVALQALAEGKPVFLYVPGLPAAPGNRALAASLTARQRELKSWGVVFTQGQQRRVITAAVAKQMAASGERPGPEAVLTPLAREILGN